MNVHTAMRDGQIIGALNGQQVVGLDIAKCVFQRYTVDICTGEISNVQIKRSKVREHFANHPDCLIAMKACGGAHHWARELSALGHSVRPLHAKVVKESLRGQAARIKALICDMQASQTWIAARTPKVRAQDEEPVRKYASGPVGKSRKPDEPHIPIKAGYKTAADFFITQRRFFLLSGRNRISPQ